MNKKYKKDMVKIFSYSRNRKFVKLQFINILNAVEQSLLNPQIKNKYRQKKKFVSSWIKKQEVLM